MGEQPARHPSGVSRTDRAAVSKVTALTRWRGGPRQFILGGAVAALAQGLGAALRAAPGRLR